jgi:adenine phosphoribosyltransferase
MDQLESLIKNTIRDVPDFPKPGILFKDITPLLGDVNLSKKITVALAEFWNKAHIDVIVGIESRGFLWGHSLAQYLEIPFVPVRKKGKLPADSYAFSYELEYGLLK